MHYNIKTFEIKEKIESTKIISHIQAITSQVQSFFFVSDAPLSWNFFNKLLKIELPFSVLVESVPSPSVPATGFRRNLFIIGPNRSSNLAKILFFLILLLSAIVKLKRRLQLITRKAKLHLFVVKL